jgi:hypothetical protein
VNFRRARFSMGTPRGMFASSKVSTKSGEVHNHRRPHCGRPPGIRTLPLRAETRVGSQSDGRHLHPRPPGSRGRPQHPSGSSIGWAPATRTRADAIEAERAVDEVRCCGGLCKQALLWITLRQGPRLHLLALDPRCQRESTTLAPEFTGLSSLAFLSSAVTPLQARNASLRPRRDTTPLASVPPTLLRGLLPFKSTVDCQRPHGLHDHAHSQLQTSVTASAAQDLPAPPPIPLTEGIERC